MYPFPSPWACHLVIEAKLLILRAMPTWSLGPGRFNRLVKGARLDRGQLLAFQVGRWTWGRFPPPPHPPNENFKWENLLKFFDVKWSWMSHMTKHSRLQKLFVKVSFSTRSWRVIQNFSLMKPKWMDGGLKKPN